MLKRFSLTKLGDKMEPESGWYIEWFNEDYLATYPHRNEDAAYAESAFVGETLGLAPNALVLDLCCGAGRHMVGTASMVGRVVGLDLSPVLLRQARDLLDRAGVYAPLVRADMRRLPFRPVFDAVTSFFTSFGYFEDDTENFAVLTEISQSLKSGGRFMLDLMHAEYVRANLVPSSLRTVGDMTIREERSIDEDRCRVNKRITIERADTTKTYRESVRMYSLDEVVAAIERAEMRVTDVYGDFRGTPFDKESARMIIMGTKP